jgi:LemA protein
MSYNVKVRQFPANILAGMFGFEAEKSFESAPGSEKAPSVNFESSAVSS